MAVNQALITGAGKAAKKFTDVGGAFSAGINSSLQGQPISSTQNKRNKINEVNSTVKGYVDTLNSEMDLVGLSQDEQNSVRGYLYNKKMEYANLANQIAQVDATSPYYMELKSKMDGIKSSFLALGDQVKNFKERKAEYLDDFESGRLSKGNNPEKYEEAAKVYAGGALSIDPNGEIYIVTDGGNELKRYADIKDPFLKRFDVANKILEQNEKLHSAGVPLNEQKEMLLRNNLEALLSEDGALESAIEDGLIGGKPLNLDIDAFPTREEAINAATDLFLQGYRDSAAQGTRLKQSKINKNNPSQTTSNQQVDLSKQTGYSERDRKVYYNKIISLNPGEKIVVPNFSGSNDPSAKRGYGQIDYEIEKGKDGNYVYVGKDSAGNIFSEGIATPEQIEKEFLGKPTKQLTAEELIKKYSQNKSE